MCGSTLGYSCSLLGRYTNTYLWFDLLQADQIKPPVHVAIESYISQKSYEVGSHVGEKFIVCGPEVILDEEVVKVASQRSHQAGYIPKEIVHQLDDL